MTAQLRLCFLPLIGLLVCACGAPLGRELLLAPRTLRRAEAIVVLGNRPPRGPDGEVAPITGRRVRRAAELFRRGLAPRLVVTGGPAPGGGTEADVMADYAEELGVPRRAIVREPLANDTAENARRTVDLLCESRGTDHCAPEVIVVTSPHHLRRAVRLFECAGARPQHAASAMPEDVGAQAAATAYEYAVGILYVFDDACGRARGPSGARR